MRLLLYLLILAVSFFISYVTTPMIRYQILKRKILKKKAIDRPNSRKIHKRVVTRMGGLAIYFSFFIVVGLTYMLNRDFAQHFTPEFTGLLLGTTIILILGIYDDLNGAKAGVKLFFQILASLVIIKYGFRIDVITSPFSESGFIETGWWAIPITVEIGRASCRERV